MAESNIEENYTPESWRIVHNVKADFVNRPVVKPVIISQYTNGISLIAVKLYTNGEEYSLPESGFFIKINWTNPNGSSVTKDIYGISEDRKTVYIEIDSTMSSTPGCGKALLELFKESEDENEEPKRAGSSLLKIEIDKNPIRSV